jgi:glutathione S-transferase
MGRPILYSFRRCPYCIRARIAIAKAGIICEMREVDLKNKPQCMLDISPKGTVPVIFLPGSKVLEESLDVMRWALKENDPDGWLNHPEDEVNRLIKICDVEFTRAIHEYKYPERFENGDPKKGRAIAMEFLKNLELRIAAKGFIVGETPSLADIAILPFVRQFAMVDWNWFDDCGLMRLRIWLNYFTDNPLFEAVMEKYSVWQPGDPVDVFPVYMAA